jgi:hypothetical protein
MKKIIESFANDLKNKNNKKNGKTENNESVDRENVIQLDCIKCQVKKNRLNENDLNTKPDVSESFFNLPNLSNSFVEKEAEFTKCNLKQFYSNEYLSYKYDYILNKID